MRRALALILLLPLGCIKRPLGVVETRPRLSHSDNVPLPEPTPEKVLTLPASKQPTTSEEWGEAYFNQGDYRRAVAALIEAVKKDPKSAKLWRNLGSAYALA